MDAVGAEESVCGGECALQLVGNIRRRQILKRPTAGRSFDFDAQARRIIGEPRGNCGQGKSAHHSE
jgi:hypothetical protein